MYLFLVPHGQHYTSTPYSHLPACHRFTTPLLFHPLSWQQPHKHPQTPVFVLFTFIHILLTPPPLLVPPPQQVVPQQIQIHASPKTPTAALSHSRCSLPVSCLQLCTVTATSDCTHLKRTPPAASGAPVAHCPFGSAAQETTCVLWLEADMQRLSRGGTKVRYISDLHGWFLS